MTTIIFIAQLGLIAAVVSLVAGVILGIIERNSQGCGYSESAQQAQRDAAKLLREINK